MPQVKDAPSALNKLLESVYRTCMLKYKSKSKCSKIAWGAAKNAGWYKDKKTGKWKKKKKKVANMQYEEGIEYDFIFGKCPCKNFTETDNAIEFDMVIVKGNSFMKGMYHSKEEVKNIHKGFENTPHDMNHMGTGYMAGFTYVPSNVSYIVGYNHNVTYDNATDEVRAKVRIMKNSYRYAEWESNKRICDAMGRIPNVSMFIKGKITYIEARKLPADSHYRKNGYKAEDMVPCVHITQAVAVSTVFEGACSDKDGCGIKNDCNGPECTNEPENSGSEDDSKPVVNEERREFLKNRIKKLKGEKYDRK